MVLEEQRFLHEDLERLEQAVSERVLGEPRNIRERLNRDHEIGDFLSRIKQQSQRLGDVYDDASGVRAAEIQTLSTGDAFEEFYKQLNQVKDFHRKYPNGIVENLERLYRRHVPDGESATYAVDQMFSGEEAYGKYFDLVSLHEQYLNLPGVKGGRRLTYAQYLEVFDSFTPPQSLIKASDKLKDEYFQYVGDLASYLESFMRKVRPLEDLEKTFAGFSLEFKNAWDAGEITGWETSDDAQPQAETASELVTEGSGVGIWCAPCAKEFKNDNIYRAHLTGKKHIKNVQTKSEVPVTNGTSNGTNVTKSNSRLKERAIAEREFRIHKLAAAMQTERSDTRVNVERRQGMTERERQQEIDALNAEAQEIGGPRDNGSDDEDEDKIYNPLKLPLAWDGKPIPYWLYKLHGLGVEFPCEICGNFVYMGRRAFDKHFSEARHIYGLKCLGVTNTTLFREITGIDDALKLWDKLQRDKKKEKTSSENVVQMEDSEGNVMPEKVYYDLQKQGLV